MDLFLMLVRRWDALSSVRVIYFVSPSLSGPDAGRSKFRFFSFS